MEIRQTATTDKELAAYASLLGQVFPNSPSLGSVHYLGWLYCENPAGAVVGSDVWVDDELAAHYVCIPMQATVEGKLSKGLLSLNTATNPKFQGRGFFTRLAQHTFETAASEKFAFVYGVANANSTPGFVKKLGFQLVSPLQAKIGIGSPIHPKMIEAKEQNASFKRIWDSAALGWRIRNPFNACQISLDRKVATISARTPYPLIRAVANINIDQNMSALSSVQANSFCMGLYLGLAKADETLSTLYWSIPEKFKPSPLNLIYKSLGAAPSFIDPKNTSISFLDFDAY